MNEPNFLEFEQILILHERSLLAYGGSSGIRDEGLIRSAVFQPQNDYYTVTPGQLNQDQGDGRVDYHLSDSTTIFGSISWSNTNKSSIPPFQGILAQDRRNTIAPSVY